MRRWLARTMGTPGSVSFHALDRTIAEAGARRRWADDLDHDALAHAARDAAGAPARSGGFAPPADLLAILRSAAQRTLGQEPFDEQLLACGALLTGHAVELDTGEGKTLAGALAAAGFAVAGRHVHVLSANDYLARRDAEWMMPLFDALDVTIGWLDQHTDAAMRAEVYRRDVVYAPMSEVGYDILRDRLAWTDEERVRPERDVAIVDEADAVMIDEAMSPLVLAGSSTDAAEDVALADALVRELDADAHYAIDTDRATVALTDAGLDLIEQRLGGVNLYDTPQTDTLTRVNLALHAHVLIERDVDYLVVDDTITLINAARGRIAHRQRWPDGLHAAIEAKERLAVSSPGVILDSLTVQDLLTGYPTLTGMSGTIVAVAAELAEFYALRSGRVERRLPNRRVDHDPHVFVDDQALLDAAVDEVRDRHTAFQPVLVGTQSVSASERFAAALGEIGIDARVINARNDDHEAAIIARAGEPGAVTISTQMSGRGTDIRLGGPDEHDHDRVAAAGGLAILQIGRYPSGRLDAQLRGRSGRQGDPGTTVTFVSTNDELVQANAPQHLLEKIRRHGRQLDQSALRRIVDDAQRIAEGVRRDRHRDTWGFSRAITRQRASVLIDREEVLHEGRAREAMAERIPVTLDELDAAHPPHVVTGLLRDVVLWCLDEQWCDHLAQLGEIRDGIHLQALAGLNPLDEFHRIALREFQGFSDTAYDRAAGIVESVDVARIGEGIAALGLRRPSATWTYMISDNPLGSPMDRAARHAGKWWRSRVYRMEEPTGSSDAASL